MSRSQNALDTVLGVEPVPEEVAVERRETAQVQRRTPTNGKLTTANVLATMETMSDALSTVLGTDPAAYIRTVQTLWRYSKLADYISDMPSIMGAVLQGAQLKLSFDPTLGQAYIVPFRGKAQLIIGYKGLTTLAVRTGLVTSIEGRLVRERDTFSFNLGSTDTLNHTYDLWDKQGRGDIVGVYAIARLPNGQNAFREPMSYAEALSYRNYSESWKRAQSSGGPNNSVWAKFEPEMLKKTAAIRLAKSLPLTNEFAAALTVDGRIRQYEGGEITPLTEIAAQPEPEYDYDDDDF